MSAFNMQAQSNVYKKTADSLLREYPKIKDDSTKVRLLCDISEEFIRINTDTAIRYANQSLQLSKKNNNKKSIAYAYYINGRVRKEASLFATGKLFLDTAINQFKDLNDITGQAWALKDLGLCYWRLGQLDKGIQAYNTILSFADTPELNKPKLGAMINSALIYEDLRLPIKEKSMYNEALIFAKEIGDEYGQIIIYSNLSSIYRHTKDFNKSVALLQHAIELSVKTNDLKEEARARSNLGATYTQMGRYDSAEKNLLLASKIGHEINYQTHLIKTTWHLAELYEKKGALKKSKKFAEESLQLAYKYKIPDDIAMGYEILRTIAISNNDPKTAFRMTDSFTVWKNYLYKTNNQKELAMAESAFNNKMLATENDRLENEKKYLRYALIGLLFLGLIIVFAIWTFLKRKKTQAELTAELLHTQNYTNKLEEYRKRRALELHDDLGQDLLLAHQSIELENTPEQTKEIIERAITKVRKISKEEFPYDLQFVGLKASLEHLIDLIEKNSNIIISEALIDLPRQFPVEQNLNIYRIVQELNNNSIKNESTNAVFIGMEQKGHKLEITYRDNGFGFDFSFELKQIASIGLKGIVNRVRMLNGILKIVPSATDNRYVIEVPLNVYQSYKNSYSRRPPINTYRVRASFVENSKCRDNFQMQ